MAQDSTGKTKTSARLTAKENRKVQDYLIANWDEIEKRKPTKNEIAARISGIYDFTVSISSLTSACDVIDKQWPKIVRKVKNTDKKWTGSVTKILAIQLALIIEKLGEKPTEEFKDLISSYNRTTEHMNS